jgi:Plant transposon protein
VLFDKLAVGLNNGTILTNKKIFLLQINTDGTISKQKYKGGYIITDNGYLCWLTTIPPFKESPYTAHLRCSKWVELMRKDVECCFGIMKGRFRIIKTGIRLRRIQACDNVWLTCCTLHNFLISEAGIDECWKEGTMPLHFGMVNRFT